MALYTLNNNININLAVTLFVQNNIMISEVHTGGTGLSPVNRFMTSANAKNRIYYPQIFRR